MKILKNLKINNENKKINASEVALVTNTNKYKSLDNVIGDLSSLNTTDKSNLVSAINEVNSKDIYSTTETKIGTWIDGKDIYRKVINLGAFQFTNGLKNVTIPNTPIETLIKGNWIFKNSNKWYFDYTTPDNIQYINATTISVGGNENINCQQFYIILEYTKPTEN